MISEAVSFKVAAMEGRLARLSAGVDNATILSYGTTRPAAGDPPGGPVLAVITLTDPAGSVNNTTGALTLTPSGEALILNTGVALWCRVLNGDGAFCFDMDAGEDGSGAEAIFTDTQLYAGGSLTLVSCVLE